MPLDQRMDKENAVHLHIFVLPPPHLLIVAGLFAFVVLLSQGLHSLGSPGTCYIEQTGSILMETRLPLPPECWDYRLWLLCLVHIGVLRLYLPTYPTPASESPSLVFRSQACATKPGPCISKSFVISITRIEPGPHTS